MKLEFCPICKSNSLMPHNHSQAELFCQNCGRVIYLDENNDWWIDWGEDLQGYVQYGSKMILRVKIKGIWTVVPSYYVWSVENGMTIHPKELN